MWPFKNSLSDTQHVPVSARQRRSLRWRLALLAFGLLLAVVLVGGWRYLKFRANTAGIEGIVGVWKHEKDDTIITLEFGSWVGHPFRPPHEVRFTSNKAGASGSGRGTYRAIDPGTLEMPAAAAHETVTIDSITSEKLVLSGGGTWKFNKTEFTRQK